MKKKEKKDKKDKKAHESQLVSRDANLYVLNRAAPKSAAGWDPKRVSIVSTPASSPARDRFAWRTNEEY